ncbi:malonate decarboxylase holo-[acyl-carrier-protein] synthase [Noviherbaspirillum galbum]|uniref:Malonate decarboxylase holo-[acyl-carrier-protein] synthase n=1 Tax=Noviherbaspirillum galbum TaxID=2709383 RepID=A0A6B3SQQ3_9BURK|nr:malonate decarboxylase holo-[acyl-carrier-protein] synthase [Noviherbaspirillum galbum]NEX63104.1 malonate decarboxylase holo-[acyl-carrier-protein] synthase [Noviherbaspirillum galbum]
MRYARAAMYNRHDLAWLSARGWQRAMDASAQTGQDGDTILRQWRDNAFPLIVRRREPGMLENEVALAIAGPPREGRKIRIALRAAIDDIVTVQPPRALADAAGAIPDTWHPAFRSLLDEAAAERLDLAMFGSVAMQAITGLPCLGAGSDIDLLCRPATRGQLDGFVSLLRRHAGALPLDGEIMFPDGNAVAWKEWAILDKLAAGSRVLAKSIDTVALLPPARLLQTLDTFGGNHG